MPDAPRPLVAPHVARPSPLILCSSTRPVTMATFVARHGPRLLRRGTHLHLRTRERRCRASRRASAGDMRMGRSSGGPLGWSTFLRSSERHRTGLGRIRSSSFSMVRLSLLRSGWGIADSVSAAPSVDALSPILYNPAFAGSLLLVASTRPLPFIEATTPPCGFPSAPPHAEIFPTVEVFSLPPTSTVRGKHQLSSLFEKASNLACAFRSNLARFRSKEMRKSFDLVSSAQSLKSAQRGLKLSALAIVAGNHHSVDSSQGTALSSPISSLDIKSRYGPGRLVGS
jgi:hypothetical protein